MSTVFPAHDQISAPGTLAARPSVWLYYVLFFISGFPALIYQIVWQRALFTLFGVNVQSVTVVVTVFMLGLGLGSVAGGTLSARRNIRLLRAFGVIELSIGAFGVFSLAIFHRVAAFTAGSSLLVTGLVAFALLLIPTLLMGSTLPLLCEHFVRRTGNVGESVGLLYGVNTLGSGLACLLAALFLMRALGESGSVHLAVSLNVLVGLTAVVLQFLPTSPAQAQVQVTHAVQQTIPFWAGFVLAGAAGFVALAYEIMWYRLYSFATGGTAASFAELLAFYLFGVAYGSRAVRNACRTRLGNDVRRTMAAGAEVVLVGSIAAYLVGPMLGLSVAHLSHIPVVFVFVAATLLGSAFPLLAHAAIDPGGKVGHRLSLIYLSNILGSTVGSFVVGFWILDRLSTRATSVLLLASGVLIALVFVRFAGVRMRKLAFVAECAVALTLILLSNQLFSGMYERLLFKTAYKPDMRFSEVVENRSGVISVFRDTHEFGYPTNIVFGGGAYDGRFNIDLMHDSNGLARTVAIAGMHPNPRHVLMIGLSSGSWAQLIANEPMVEDITIVEINPGYLPLIRRHPQVASLLDNPKVHIVIDDGRRWLVAHPDRRFDLLVMNTTFNWRANISNLLSLEFLRLARAHLAPGGILYYNTTWAREVIATGLAEYPYALRYGSFLAVSDRPFMLDKNRWQAALVAWRIDGHPIFDLDDPAQKAKMEALLAQADQVDAPESMVQSRAGLLIAVKGVPLITDDNMGTEWIRR